MDTYRYYYRENLRAKGAGREEEAAGYLEQQGYQVLTRNYYIRGGEIDLIAEDGEYLVFVEVKYRSSRKAGDPAEAVTPEKQKRIIRAARVYMMKEHIRPDRPVRFDVVSILDGEIRLIRDAFWMEQD